MSVLVVTPTYNERENLDALVGRLREALGEVALLVVDDGSPDGTADHAEALGARVLRREAKAGLASAYQAGFRIALDEGYDRIVQMDADLSHDPADVPRLLAADADLVLGSRYVPGGGTRNWPLGRRLLSRFGSTYSRVWLGLPYRDLTGGFKAWRREALEAVEWERVHSGGYVFQIETTYLATRAGATVTEVPIVFKDREVGTSKMSKSIIVEALVVVLQLRWEELRGRGPTASMTRDDTVS